MYNMEITVEVDVREQVLIARAEATKKEKSMRQQRKF